MYYNITSRSRVRRRPDRAVYERAQIEAILDEAFLCHVGLVSRDATPVVIPMVYGRAGNVLYLHGSPASRLLDELPRANDACVTVTLMDGIVLARSARKHSLNYRSVVALGSARAIAHPAEKLAALRTIVDHVLPGRSGEARSPTQAELSATHVLAFTIEEASAKMRSGPPQDDEADRSLAIWAGEVPVRMVMGEPVCDPWSMEAPLPAALARLRACGASADRRS
jgi:nitroimidazol reductase NimA-like FMN-containing flavoprotein (pyridoxamine 5'-phosphate oxidase superfamily)